MSRKQWRCFHCDELFTSPRWAAEHFGSDLSAEPACKISSAEGHLVTYIRKLESCLAQYRAQDSDVLRSIYSFEADHQQALIRAEESGYNKGVRDALNMPADERAKIETAACRTLRCMMRGGYVRGVLADDSISTCEEHETAVALRFAATRAAGDAPVAWMVSFYDDEDLMRVKVYLSFEAAHTASARSDYDTVTEPLVLAVPRPTRGTESSAPGEAS